MKLTYNVYRGDKLIKTVVVDPKAKLKKLSLKERITSWLIKRGWLTVKDTTFSEYIPEAEQVEAGKHPEPFDHTKWQTGYRKGVTKTILDAHAGGPLLYYRKLSEPIKHIPIETQVYIVELVQHPGLVNINNEKCEQLEK